MIQKVLEFIKSHPKLVVAQDFELACQKIKIKKQQHLNGQPSIQSFDESWWVQLKVLHRNQAGVAVSAALTEGSLDRLVSEALLSAEQSTRDPWFRFPVWPSRKDEGLANEIKNPPPGFWDSCWSLLDNPPLTFQESYEWSEIETAIYRRSEKTQRSFRQATAFQKWSLGKCHESFWGDENREKRIQGFKKAAYCLENARKWELNTPLILSLSGKAMTPLLQQIATWFHAPAIKSKKSPVTATEQGAQIMSELVTLVDDASQICSQFSGPFDLDGISEQKTVLVKNGLFRGALYDAYSGAMDNCRSTGNKVRDFQSLEPELRAKAICLEPGGASADGFWKESKSGFALAGWSRLEFPSIRYLEGDAYGWRIDHGVPVGPFYIEGLRWDLVNLMRQIIFVANDFEKHGLSVSPTVFVKGAL